MEFISALKINWPLYNGEIKLSWLVLHPGGHNWYGVRPKNMGESELTPFKNYLKPLSSLPFPDKNVLRHWPKSACFFGEQNNIFAFGKVMGGHLKIWHFFLLPEELCGFNYFKKASRLSAKLFYQFQREQLHRWLEPAGTAGTYREEYGLLAHQLKSPVISLKQRLHSLKEKYPGEKDVIEGEEYQLGNLQKYIDTQLILYKGAVYKNQKAAINVYDLLHQLELFFYPAFREKCAAFILDTPPKSGKNPLLIQGRMEWIFQSLHNIVENGLSFCGAGGWVKIKVKTVSNSVNISIFDSGPGVLSVSIPNLFSPFFTTRRGGSGIGLYFAKKMAEWHGGSLQYVPGQGEEKHCFAVSLLKFGDEKTLRLTGEYHGI